LRLTLPVDASVWVSAIEHPCLLEPARFHFGERLRVIPVTRAGIVKLNWVQREFKRQRPALVAVMAANNESGALQPWTDVLHLCREHEVPFFCDAVQWVGKLPSHDLGGCDWLSGSAHKFGGPRGVGFLKVPSSLSLHPLLRGGPQEERRRAGTENVPGVLSMIAALEVREKQIERNEFRAKEKARHEFENDLRSNLPGAEIIAADSPRLWNTVFALMPEAHCQQRWVVKLDKLGFAVSTGSACSSGKEESSHVLQAMGHSGTDASRALRFSAGWETSAADWQALLAALRAVNSSTARGKSFVEKSSVVR
jgi:cysteine desulfurase